MKLSEEKQKICVEATKIANSDECWVYLQEHGVSGQDLWLYKQDYAPRDTALTRSRALCLRKLALMKQSNQCALCDTGIELGFRCCLDKTGKVVCRRCNLLLVSWRRARADGISEELMVKFDTEAQTETNAG